MTDDDGNAFRRNGEAWMNWTDLARGVMYAVELILCVKVLGDCCLLYTSDAADEL